MMTIETGQRPTPRETKMATITITTPRGAIVELDSGETGGLISAKLNGKPHTSMGVELGHDPEIGHHLKLAGKLRAQVRSEDVEKLRAFFRNEKQRHAEWVANYKLSATERSDALTERMDDPYSDL
ncbi:hypothetical protein [Afifella sp. YEN Y35]|uniref:hypothetical protein n=1 Tax=Afifella sp. YEN Y35 TaxID=3388337 RepID=UPI0039DF566B